MFFYRVAPGPFDPYAANVKLLLRGDSGNNTTNYIDSSVNNLTVSNFGNTFMTTSSIKYGASSMYFGGSGSYMTVPGASFNLAAGSFTVEMWVNPLSATVNNQTKYLFGIDRSAVAGFAGMIGSLTYSLAANKYSLGIVATTTGTGWTINNQNITSGFNISPNTWIHLAFVRNVNSWLVYVNGVRYTIGTFAGSVTFTNGVGIGADAARSSGLNNYFGYIDDFRVTKGIARYTDPIITPPSAL